MVQKTMADVDEGVLNLLEMIIRCYDCWLSCAAHLTIVDKDGNKIYEREMKIGTDWNPNKNLRFGWTTPQGFPIPFLITTNY